MGAEAGRAIAPSGLQDSAWVEGMVGRGQVPAGEPLGE